MNTRPYHEEPPQPKTETIPKTVKKSFIGWVVPALCFALVFATFTVAKSWADDRYTQKKDSDAARIIIDTQMAEERQKREAIEQQEEKMNRKLDLILYILQNSGKSVPAGP